MKDEYGTDPRIEHCAVIISFLHWNRFQSETLSGMAPDLTTRNTKFLSYPDMNIYRQNGSDDVLVGYKLSPALTSVTSCKQL